ncbi:MAG: type II secretion system F family protein [Xanthomonadales bacterium]|nr:type II secretion system F family protein [Xanthomonadales bacterium]
MATKAAELPIFTWEGTDKRGTKIKGEQVAKNVNLVKAELRRQGINPTKVKKKAKPLFGATGKAIKSQDIAVFSRQLATMMQAGVPLVQGFEIVAGGQENPRMRDMLIDIKQNIEAGSSLSESLARHPVHFDELYVNLVQAGEQAGVLDTLLDEIATYKERIEEIKSKIKKAMFYPIAVIGVAIIVSLILLIYVVPQFQVIFEDAGTDLPAFTQLIINISEWLQNNGAIVFGGIGAGIAAFIFVKKRSKPFNHFLDRVVLKIPVIGQIMHNSAIARFSRTLATTFAAGVPLVDALETVSGATGNQVYGDAVKQIKEDVSVGHQLQLAMRQVNLFPHMVIQMTAIGEESGALDTMLKKVAEFYENEVNQAVDALSSLLEPLIMVVIGGLVGSLVVGMYLPIFKLAATV